MPFQTAAKLAAGGAEAITRRATSSPTRLPARVRSPPRDPVPACSRSRASSRAIEARTAESANSSVSTAADAVATAASAETARSRSVELAAAYWATLSMEYTRKRNGTCGTRRSAAESPAAPRRAARRLAVASSRKPGTSHPHLRSHLAPRKLFHTSAGRTHASTLPVMDVCQCSILPNAFV